MGSKQERLKRFSHHFFTFLPEGFGVGRVQCVGSYTLADSGNGEIIGNDIANAAVLAVATANLVCGSDHGGPDGSGGALWNGLPLEGPFSLREKLIVQLGDQVFDAARLP